jgi:erythromycin esterase-like protein
VYRNLNVRELNVNSKAYRNVLLCTVVCLSILVPLPTNAFHSDTASFQPATALQRYLTSLLFVDDDESLSDELREIVYPLDEQADYQPLLSMIGDARIVLIGEASHGTEQFYRTRAEITQQLIEHEGFTAVAVEADWHAAYRVNEYVRGTSTDESPEAALREFDNFPVWMWRNTVVQDFVAWLHDYNSNLGSGQTEVGFYGLDLYGMYESADAVVERLKTVDPASAQRARQRYTCFTELGASPEAYAATASRAAEQTCQEEALEQLTDVQRRRRTYQQRLPFEDVLSLEQNARVVANGEAYYRAMYDPTVSTWNLRDEHMASSANALLEHLQAQGANARIVIWAHNSHIGDAEATDMWERGELNLGHLLREQYGDEAVLIGFSTYSGTVTAAHNWGEDPHLMAVNPGLPESYEALFHEVGVPNFLLILKNNEEATNLLSEPRFQRAIGVIYRPETERFSHYLEADLPAQFDAIIHIDETRAIEPIDPIPSWQAVGSPSIDG